MPNLSYGDCLSGSDTVDKFFSPKFSMTADFTQVFTLDNRETITGTIKLKRPNFLKISLDAPLNSEVLINEKYIFQTDFDLDQTVRYDREKMIEQIPAGIMLLSKKTFCKSFEIEICNNKKCVLRDKKNKVELVFNNEVLNSLSFQGPNLNDSTIYLENLVSALEINDSAFSYNHEVKDLLIFNNND